MPVCILVADLTVTPSVVLDVNRRAELVYGYTAAELVGQATAHLVPDESRAGLQRLLRRARRGETVTAETTNRRRDGTTFPVRVIATVDPVNNGHLIVAVEDIAAEKQRRSETDAIDAERLHIAHEIHDGVAQSLAALRFKSALWAPQVEAFPPAMRAALAELQDVLGAAIADIRRVIFALRPVDLDAMGFFPAVTQLVTDVGEHNHLVARLDVSGPQDALPEAYELPLFRVIQHGLSNIAQHARASSVRVRLSMKAGGAVALSLGDNGRGFDPGVVGAADRPGHYGLRQMRERILALGGTLDIRSVSGQGTELLITLPPVIQEVADATDSDLDRR
jgi:PAS domain S-box-containing protein